MLLGKYRPLGCVAGSERCAMYGLHHRPRESASHFRLRVVLLGDFPSACVRRRHDAPAVQRYRPVRKMINNHGGIEIKQTIVG